MHAHDRVIVKATLLHRTVLQGNFTPCRSGQSIDDAALHLTFHSVRVHDETTVDDALNTVQGHHLFSGNGELDHLSDHRTKGLVNGNA